MKTKFFNEQLHQIRTSPVDQVAEMIKFYLTAQSHASDETAMDLETLEYVAEQRLEKLQGVRL